MRLIRSSLLYFPLCCLFIFHDGARIVSPSRKSARKNDGNVTVCSLERYSSKRSIDAYNHAVTYNVELKCGGNSECTARNSSCIEGLCQCPAGYVFKSDLTACLKVATSIEDECEEALQCSSYLLSGGNCIDGLCTCGTGYHYLHGKCYATIELGDKCTEDDDCFVNHEFGSTVCRRGTCDCKSGYYQREHRSCRRKAKVGEPCVIDIDCELGVNSSCVDLVCVEMNVVTDLTMTPNAISNVDDYHNNNVKLSIAEERREKTEPHEFDTCTEDSDCESHSNTVCARVGVCICERGFYYDKKKKECFPELGESCRAEDKGGVKRSLCLNGTWSCEPGYVPLKNNRLCKKVTNAYNSSCLRDEQCQVFGPEAMCNEKRCLCNENSHYLPEIQYCWKTRGIGESCKVDEDCQLKGSNEPLTCTKNVCTCRSGSHPSLNKTKCIPDVPELENICEMPEDCEKINAICEDQVCVCPEYHFPSNKKCVSGINATCTGKKDCNSVASICSSNVCVCKKGYVPVSVDTCEKVSPYGGVCKHDAQCSAVTLNAVCSSHKNAKATTAISTDLSTRVCTCPDGHRFRFGGCHKKKALGEPCDYISECHLDINVNRVVCRKGKCACKWGFEPIGSFTCESNRFYRSLSSGAIEVVSRMSLPTTLLVTMLLSLM